MDVREKYVMQKVSRKEKSICPNCIHHNLCIAENNQPCFECNRYIDANGVTVQEWISASEPPKKITNKVIVLCKNGYIGYGHYEDYKCKQTWYNLESGKPFTDWDLEDCESYEVTHWMPLPEPPEAALKGE